MLEAISRFEDLFGKTLGWNYVDEARRGDHVCYISDMRRFQSAYPDWELSVSLDSIFEQFAEGTRRADFHGAANR
jgi:CDP-paratose 2-epimerase